MSRFGMIKIIPAIADVRVVEPRTIDRMPTYRD